MRQSTGFLAIVVLLALVVLTVFVDRQSAAQAPPGLGPPTKWEYKTLALSPDAEVNDGGRSQLNQLGMEGWDLCAAVERQQGGPFFVLKRPIRLGRGNR
jgi:hypothetical protein